MNLNKITQNVGWFTISKPFEAILLALRAGITEEIIFRLFLFSLLIWLLQKITAHFNLENKKEKITIFSAIIASIIFAALHSFNILAFVLGLMLTFIYFKKGLIPVMIVHFFADVIPFLLVVINLN